MTKDVYTLTADQSIAEAMDMFLEKKISGAPVVNERGRIVGILSEIDCMRILVDEAYFNLPHGKITVAKYMSETVQTLHDSMDVLDCAQKIPGHQLQALSGGGFKRKTGRHHQP